MQNPTNEPEYQPDERLLATLATFPDTPLRRVIENFCSIKQQISQLSQDIEKAAEKDKPRLRRSLRRLEKVDYKDAQGKLISAILQLRQYLSKPKDLTKYGDEYKSLLYEVIALACNKLCEEFEPKENKPLEKSLVNWINYGSLRLYYQVVELTSPGKRTKNERLLDLLIEWVNFNEGEVSLEAFAKEANLKVTEAKEFLDEQMQAFEGRVEDVTYFFIPERVRQSPETELKRQIQQTPYELDAPMGEDGATFGHFVPDKTTPWKELEKITPKQTITQKIQFYLTHDPENRLGNCLTDKPYTCRDLIQRAYLNSESFADVAESYHINRQTLQADWERHCLPLLYTVIIELTDTEKLRNYIENDYLDKLKKCYFEVSECNCKILAMRLLPCFKSPPDKIGKKLAEEYGIEQIPVQRFKRFWNLRGLHLLSKIAVELEKIEE